MSTKRAINMRKRRERILAEARGLIASKGFEALNLRDLAHRSGVTVPTIYNLVGKKEEILRALMQGVFEDFEVELEKQLPCRASALPELMTDTLVGMIEREEQFYRAAALANEHAESLREKSGEQGITRPTINRIFSGLCRKALAEGLLRGDIEPALLAEQMTNSDHVMFRDWAHRGITLDEFRNRSLSSLYIALAADAVDSFREELIRRLRPL